MVKILHKSDESFAKSFSIPSLTLGRYSVLPAISDWIWNMRKFSYQRYNRGSTFVRYCGLCSVTAILQSFALNHSINPNMKISLSGRSPRGRWVNISASRSTSHQLKHADLEVDLLYMFNDWLHSDGPSPCRIAAWISSWNFLITHQSFCPGLPIPRAGTTLAFNFP
jgi:hypothetical protein